ncbi:MAG: glycosyltransferase family 39 protein [Caldimonas sp.]
MPAHDASALAAAARPAGWRWLAPTQWLGALAAFAWLASSIGLRPLTLPEEGRYVGVAWEMLRSGNWLVPTEDGLPFFHKPPLFYWITAASMQTFGGNAAAARLAPLFGAVVGALGVYWLVRRRADETLARLTMLVLVTTPFFFGAAQFANLDMLVAGFIALTIGFAADAALALRAGEPHRRALAAAWAFAALAVLAKGLIGLVLPAGVMLVWLVVSGQPRTILRLLSPLGLAVFALVAAPWFIAVQMQYPAFARYFFVHHHIERFAASGFNNIQPWWFFVVAVPLLALPWSLWLIGSTFKARPAETADATAVRSLMWVWLVAILFFFSIPKSKPVGYAMPVLFPLAFLIADAVVAARRHDRPWLGRAVQVSVVAAVAICIAAVVWGATYDRDNTALARALARMRAPGDPIVFVGEYFFDIPLHARLSEPVPVISDWRDPKIAERDNWRRELAEAAPFDPERARTLLLDAEHAFALRCGKAPLWAVAKVDGEALLAALPGATRVLVSNRVGLWRVEPRDCAAAPAVTRARP